MKVFKYEAVATNTK